MDATAHDLEQRGRPGRGDAEAAALRLADLRLEAPDGRVLLEGANATVAPGERVAIAGPSGTGKTILLRAHRRHLAVRRGPHRAAGAARACCSSRSSPTCRSGRCARRCPTRRRRQLPGRAHPRGAARCSGSATSRRGSTSAEPWDQHLSAHEQQRLALARVLLHEPDWLFLDKATSALDEAMEKRVYELLAERLPDAHVISIAHRPAVAAYHERRWTLAPHEQGASRSRPRDGPRTPTRPLGRRRGRARRLERERRARVARRPRRRARAARCRAALRLRAGRRAELGDRAARVARDAAGALRG